MKSNPLVSIIVPVYNKEPYLKACVDSLIGQTYENIEIILVDDESTDNSGKICDEYASNSPKVKVIHKSNGGLVSAWKTGVLESSGELLGFVDSDDYVDVNMISEMIQQIDDEDSERLVISSDYIIERDSGKNSLCYQRLTPGKYNRNQLVNDVIPNLLGYEHRIIHYSRCMKLIGRELIVSNMKYADERLTMGEDMSIILPVLIDAETLIVMDHKAYYHYRYVETSMAHDYDPKAFEKNRLLYTNVKNTLMEKFASDDSKLKYYEAALNREEIFLLFFTVKSTVGSNTLECLRRIKHIRNDSVTSPIITDTKVSVNAISNRIIYFTLKHPVILTVLMLKFAFKIYYR